MRQSRIQGNKQKGNNKSAQEQTEEIQKAFQKQRAGKNSQDRQAVKTVWRFCLCRIRDRYKG